MTPGKSPTATLTGRKKLDLFHLSSLYDTLADFLDSYRDHVRHLFKHSQDFQFDEEKAKLIRFRDSLTSDVTHVLESQVYRSPEVSPTVTLLIQGIERSWEALKRELQYKILLATTKELPGRLPSWEGVVAMRARTVDEAVQLEKENRPIDYFSLDTDFPQGEVLLSHLRYLVGYPEASIVSFVPGDFEKLKLFVSMLDIGRGEEPTSIPESSR